MPAEKRNIDVRRQDNSKLSKARVILWFERCISEEYTPPGYLLSLLIVVLLVQALTFRLGCYLITSFCLDDALVCPFLYSSQCGAVANSPASIPVLQSTRLQSAFFVFASFLRLGCLQPNGRRLRYRERKNLLR